MRNKILYIVLLVVFVLFFAYMTSNSDSDVTKNDSVQTDNVSVVAKSTEVGQSAEKQLSDVFLNADQLQPSELLQEAELLLLSNDEESVNDGLLVLNYLSDIHNAEAQYLLAQLYEKGILVSQDEARAFEFYEQAALNGSEDGNIYLFNYYLDNNETSSEHYKNALNWFHKSVENNPKNGIGFYALGYMSEYGLGVDIDTIQAIKYYEQATGVHFILAYERLGNLYLTDADDKQQVQNALLLFQQAANEDIATAQGKLGSMYELGMGTKQDYETARFWYQKAANNHLVNAYFSLGYLYANGLGVDKDNTQAHQYYLLAAKGGDQDGQMAIARTFERGLGVDADLNQAIAWYEKAAMQGNAMASYNLGRIFEEYDAVLDLESAQLWYQKAADANIEEAKSAIERISKE